MGGATLEDFLYDFTRAVESTCEDYSDYPALDGGTTTVTCNTYGCDDTGLGYLSWWFAHVPRAPGTGPDGRLANWWTYLLEPQRIADLQP